MKHYLVLAVCLVLMRQATAQVVAPKRVKDDMADAAKSFLAMLNPEQRKQATYPFADNERFTWDFVPHARHGLTLKQMQPEQRKVAMELLKTGLSAGGYDKALQIMDLENVLRVVENRPTNDTYRDSENYYFTVFGDVDTKEPWGWRVEGHHLSVQFSTLTGQVMSLTPMFMGSNPGIVRAEVPQKGKQLMRDETELAFALLHTMTEAQLNQATLAKKAFGNITTGNSRRASLERMDGLPLAEMNTKQRALFLEILGIYLNRYRITLAKQQMDRVEKAGIDKLRFAWAGDTTANNSIGYYYRIHGPMLLIEYDNSQNNANHVHTVVRDLTNDFGDDLLREHYEKQKH